jgi:hypothetical protein
MYTQLIVAAIVFLALVATFAIRSWQAQGRLVARDRWALLTDCARALAAFALATMLIDWTVAPAALWLIAVALLAGGVAGTAVRWPGLAWYAGTRPLWRAGGVIATLCLCALVIGVAAF